MLIEQFSLSGVSAEAYRYINPISLTKKWIDGKRLTTKIDISGGTSGVLYVICEFTDNIDSGATYVPLHTFSGTSVIFSGNSIAGLAANGSVIVPLTLGNGGVTDFVRPMPFVRFGYRCFQEDLNFVLTLIAS